MAKRDPCGYQKVISSVFIAGFHAATVPITIRAATLAASACKVAAPGDTDGECVLDMLNNVDTWSIQETRLQAL